jgi:tetratricopeptide (TPR) repeat protein
MPHSAASAWPLSRRGLVQATGATALAAAAAALAWWRLGRPAVPAPTGRARIAVLPFADHGAGPALAQGLALDVIRMLGQRADLDVMAPDTVLGLSAGNEAERAALVQRLQVQYLLVGELAPARPLLHLDVRLFGSRSDAAMWQRRFESAAPELSQLPARVARELSAVLGLPALAQAPGPGASDAYELYVLGVNAWQAKTPEAFEKARQYFQRGIDLDPNFARNHVGLGWSWLGQATSGPGLDVPQAIARATPLFERALALDPEAADALTGQAMLYRFAGEFDTARRLLERAIAVQPSYRQALFTLGIVEFDDGWPDKAAAQFERVVALDPLGASGPERLGLARMLGGQTDVAARHFRRALTLEPRYPNGVWGLGMLGYALGNLVQAVDNYRQALALEPRRPYLWHELAWLYLDLQRPDEAATAFQRALEHLPGVGWLAVHAALAWVSRGADASRGAAPSALEPTPRRADDGADFASLCFVRAMAGLPVDAALLQRSLDVAAARGQQWTPGAWFVFMGWYGQLQLATLQAMLGQSATAANTLTSVEQRLDTLERQGNRWHALHFHRARVLALRGRPTDAMAALERAVAGGSRRAWWLRLDPALAALRSQPRFGRLLSEVDTLVAGQRQQLGL